MQTPRKRSRFGRFLLVLVVLVVGAIVYAALRYQESPRELWSRLVTFIQSHRQPEPLATPAPAETPPPIEETPTPAPAATDLAQVEALRWVVERRESWPKEVTLLRRAEFPVVFDGRTAGSAYLLPGTVVEVVEITGTDVAVAHRGGKRRLPISATDLPRRAEIAFAQARAAPPQPKIAMATPPEKAEPSPETEEALDDAGEDLPPAPPPPLVPGGGQSIRVTTWNLAWFPHGTPEDAPAQHQEKYIAAAAGVLRQIDPDILLLQEVQDLDACKRLAEAIKPGAYHVAICSAFRVGRDIGRQQLAVLAKQPAQAAWAEEWKSRGGVDPPRGFAFGWFRIRGADIGVYSVHLKSNRERGPPSKKGGGLSANIRQREVAAEQLVQHMKAVIPRRVPSIRAVVIGGDFNTNPDDPRFAEERTIRTLLDGGFQNCMELLPKTARYTMPGGKMFPPTTFDYIVARGATCQPPRIVRTRVSDHYPVTVDLQVPASRGFSPFR